MLQVSYIVRFVALTAAGVLLLALIIGGWSFFSLTRRLRRLTEAVRSYREGDFNEPVVIPALRRDASGDEIDLLGVLFEGMSRQIAVQFEQIKEADISRREMITNISHDLKTPLTTLQGYLETLTMKGSALSAEERQAHIEISMKQVKRLGGLITELFELATLEDRSATVQYAAS